MGDALHPSPALPSALQSDPVRYTGSFVGRDFVVLVQVLPFALDAVGLLDSVDRKFECIGAIALSLATVWFRPSYRRQRRPAPLHRATLTRARAAPGCGWV